MTREETRGFLLRVYKTYERHRKDYVSGKLTLERDDLRVDLDMDEKRVHIFHVTRQPKERTKIELATSIDLHVNMEPKDIEDVADEIVFARLH